MFANYLISDYFKCVSRGMILMLVIDNFGQAHCHGIVSLFTKYFWKSNENECKLKKNIELKMNKKNIVWKFAINK